MSRGGDLRAGAAPGTQIPTPDSLCGTIMPRSAGQRVPGDRRCSGASILRKAGDRSAWSNCKDATTIGRTADNDIILELDGVSHCHAMLLAQPDGVMLFDLGSTFGTFVDTVQALPDEPVRLRDGARISIGRAVLRYAAYGRATSIARPDVPPRLVSPHLNTRFEGLAPDEPLRSAGRCRYWSGSARR